jgi:hypothetical protein
MPIITAKDIVKVDRLLNLMLEEVEMYPDEDTQAIIGAFTILEKLNLVESEVIVGEVESDVMMGKDEQVVLFYHSFIATEELHDLMYESDFDIEL